MNDVTNLSSNSPVSTKIIDLVGIITIDYPPVNALGQAVRQGLLEAVVSLESDDSCNVIIIQCVGRTFIAGADIKEFGSKPLEPFLPDVVNRIEACTKPVIASLFGTSLGGGLEVALSCHYRVVLSSTKVGLPEVNLGLIPGAGGTQRLMRLIGVEAALDMITTGNHVAVTKLSETEFFDAIFSSDSDDPLVDLQQMTLTFARQLISSNQLSINTVGKRVVDVADFNWDLAEQSISKKARGRIAPLVAFNILKSTWNKSIEEGMAIERVEFMKLLASEQSAALRHAFTAEKKAAKINSDAKPLAIKQVGIIGGGTMGAGICTAFLGKGYTVHLIEQTEDACKAAYRRIQGNFDNNVKRGRISQVTASSCISCLSTSYDKNNLENCDLIIEAIFEDIDVKKALFAELDSICSSHCIFATNTSYLDINEIASASKFPERVIGMHFFSPANIMKLLEVVQADQSSPQALATAMQVGKKLGKVSVLVNVCFGFAGNRMYSRYGREIQQMLLEGAKVEQIDSAMTKWGMAMGPLAVQDLSGIDIGYRARNSRAFPEHDPGYFRAAAAMVENGRLGRKTELGFYRYDDKGRAQIDPLVAEIITQKSTELAIEQRNFSDEEIVNRALYALISEGLQLFKDGIVQRLSDIDIIWLHGYGFPRYRGGPMFQAQLIGADALAIQMTKYQQQFGTAIWPDVKYDI
jgi:3-hydroxyacyl-CoA dehydrogenase